MIQDDFFYEARANQRVLLIIRGEDDRWDTSLFLTRDDAIELQELLTAKFTTSRIDLPSLNGFAEIKDGVLRLVYRTTGIITACPRYALDVLSEAIDTAEQNSEAEAARERIWSWAEKRSEKVREICVDDGDQLLGTLLHTDSGIVVIRLSDDALVVSDVVNGFSIPSVGQVVVLTLGEHSAVTISVAC